MKRRAFTLVELLVVVAVIAVLLAIFSPSFQGLQKYAQDVQCRSNLHQQGIAMLAYVNANEKTYPMVHGWFDAGISCGPHLPCLFVLPL